MHVQSGNIVAEDISLASSGLAEARTSCYFRYQYRDTAITCTRLILSRSYRRSIKGSRLDAVQFTGCRRGVMTFQSIVIMNLFVVKFQR